MRLHCFLFVAATTLLANSDVVAASTDSTHTELSTAAESTLDVRMPARALNEGNDKRYLRISKTTDEDDEEENEARGVPVASFYTDEITTRGLIKYLKKKSFISKQRAKELKISGLSKHDIAEMYSKYVALVTKPQRG
ncbi:hypothetical protein F441_15258 [Phytophthora nicotianae CJ01A1]|uniref:RxLR effector protein n=5 Tax=Phytophthora nicotianae TaxID=4792 RepID=W2XZJ5_PHYNI|nr:hypothetical protein L915_14994 [Phytophthora nicotianae]ETO58708.1 hypothetical protein F444_22911 [Phytophthora nicotianae P1976]ETP08829.1 hypothetical protein F441_15258 [Phytophthora nicotianae CJ01A1]ETP27803.1 hypothetical protein F442_22913 [Phytophthora nicotianae P10297]ETL32548.1 hypothetical protein L916_14893 [Phytophthora nicotianae]